MKPRKASYQQWLALSWRAREWLWRGAGRRQARAAWPLPRHGSIRVYPRRIGTKEPVQASFHRSRGRERPPQFGVCASRLSSDEPQRLAAAPRGTGLVCVARGGSGARRGQLRRPVRAFCFAAEPEALLLANASGASPPRPGGTLKHPVGVARPIRDVQHEARCGGAPPRQHRAR